MSTDVQAAAAKKPSFPVAAFRALRVKQWTKNGVLLVPLIFAHKASLTDSLVRGAVAILAYSLLASGVYILNDWFDREKDRLHPEKKKRPIAAGHLNGMGASITAVAAWGFAFGLGVWLGTAFLGVIAAYLVMQFFYTFLLKHMVILDVMTIAAGFILRVIAGAVAIDVPVSNWLYLCTLLGAIFLGFAKRRAELSTLEESATAHRANLADYSLTMIDQMMSISAAACILGYGLYTVSKETVDRIGSDNLKFTVPCVIYGVFRYLFLVHKRGLGGAPEKVLLGDKALLIDIVLFLAIASWAIYGV